MAPGSVVRLKNTAGRLSLLRGHAGNLLIAGLLLPFGQKTNETRLSLSLSLSLSLACPEGLARFVHMTQADLSLPAKFGHSSLGGAEAIMPQEIKSWEISLWNERVGKPVPPPPPKVVATRN